MLRMDSQENLSMMMSTNADKETDAPTPIEPRNPPCRRVNEIELQNPHDGKGLTSGPSYVVSHCEFVTFPLVTWVSCGT